MADNIPVTAGSGTNVATDDIGGTHHQRVKLSLGADGTANDAVAGAGAVGTGVQRVTLASDDPAVAVLSRSVVTSSTSYTRPADTTAYAAGDAFSNSTSSPAVLTFTNVVPASGKGAIIASVDVVSSAAPSLPLQGVLHLFDTAPTAVNDNAAWTVSDAQMLTHIAAIPFQCRTIGANSHVHVDCAKAFTSVGGTSIFGLVEVTNAYTPASGEVLSFRLQIAPVG